MFHYTVPKPSNSIILPQKHWSTKSIIIKCNAPSSIFHITCFPTTILHYMMCHKHSSYHTVSILSSLSIPCSPTQPSILHITSIPHTMLFPSTCHLHTMLLPLVSTHTMPPPALVGIQANFRKSPHTVASQGEPCSHVKGIGNKAMVS